MARARLFFLLNLVFFQTLWFGAVLGAGAYALHWLAIGTLIPISVLAWYSPTRQADFTLAGVALAVGIIADNLWVYVGILDFPGHSFAPYWIGFLWYGLGLTINHSLSWFRDRTLLGPLIVGLFAPLSYFAGERLGAVSVLEPQMTPIISLSWIALFFALTQLATWQRQAQSDLIKTKGS